MVQWYNRWCDVSVPLMKLPEVWLSSLVCLKAGVIRVGLTDTFSPAPSRASRHRQSGGLSLVLICRDTVLSLVEPYYKVYAITTHLKASQMSPTRDIWCLSGGALMQCHKDTTKRKKNPSINGAFCMP